MVADVAAVAVVVGVAAATAFAPAAAAENWDSPSTADRHHSAAG